MTHTSFRSIGKRILSLALLGAVATCTADRTPLSPLNVFAMTQSITQTLLTAGSSATNLNNYTTASIAPAPNALITVAVRNHRSPAAISPTLSGGGMTSWTQVASVDYDPITGSLGRLTVFRALSASPGSGPITITFSNSVSNVDWIVSQWTGVDASGVNGAGAIVQSASARGDAVTTLSVPLAAFGDANNVAYGVVGARLNAPAVTPGSGFTEIAEVTPGENTLLEAQWAVNLTTISASLTTAKNAALLGIEIKAGAGGGGVPALPPDSVPQDLYAASNLITNSPSLPATTFVRDVVDVLFEAGTSQVQRQAAVDLVGGVVIGGSRFPDGDGFYLVRVPGDGTDGPTLNAIATLKGLPSVSVAVVEMLLENADGYSPSGRWAGMAPRRLGCQPRPGERSELEPRGGRGTPSLGVQHGGLSGSGGCGGQRLC